MSTLRKYSHPCLQCDLSLYMFSWGDSWQFRHFARFTHQDFPSYAHKHKHVDAFLPSTHKSATAQICLWRFIGLEHVTQTGNKFVRMQLEWQRRKVTQWQVQCVKKPQKSEVAFFTFPCTAFDCPCTLWRYNSHMNNDPFTFIKLYLWLCDSCEGTDKLSRLLWPTLSDDFLPIVSSH